MTVADNTLLAIVVLAGSIDQLLNCWFAAMNHAMVLTGVNLDENGKPTRWKIENSWGDASGQKGYYIGSEKWFKANVYQITVRKSLLSDAQRALLDQEPLPMKLWDPLA